MVKGVIRLDSQLGINALSEPEVLCRGNIPVVNPGSVEWGSVPSSSDLALGWQIGTPSNFWSYLQLLHLATAGSWLRERTYIRR